MSPKFKCLQEFKVQDRKSKVRNFEVEAEPQITDKPIEVGTKVLTRFGNVGTVEKIDKEKAEVLVGSMRLREKLENLKAVVERKNAAETIARRKTANSGEGNKSAV